MPKKGTKKNGSGGAQPPAEAPRRPAFAPRPKATPQTAAKGGE